jgi:hypothetical protein
MYGATKPNFDKSFKILTSEHLQCKYNMGHTGKLETTSSQYYHVTHGTMTAG